MFILITLGLFLLKFLALGVVGLFFLEDLELTKNASAAIYSTYLVTGICTFLSLLFFVLGKKLLWLIIFAVSGIFYLGMYNSAPGISDIHRQNDLKSRYFQDTGTFFARMGDMLKIINKNKQ